MGKKFFVIGLSILCFLWFQSPTFGQESLGLSDLQHSLKMKRARWAAGQTSMTRLSPAEQRKRLGLLSPLYTGGGAKLSLEAQGETPLSQPPATLDWRNHGGNFVTPVRDQGNCGSCWAFASTAALESSTLIANNTPDINLDLSEQVLVSCGGTGSCNGGYIDKTANFMKLIGLPVESCYPYTATDGSCSKACGEYNYKISEYQNITADESSLKIALYNYGPLVTTMVVFDDFFSYKSGVYHYVTGMLAGKHAILLVGYDDAGQYFIAKNSWGTGWGEGGFFRIAYSELDSDIDIGCLGTIAYVGSHTCSFEVGQPSPASFPASGGSGTLAVTAGSGCLWTAGSSDSWITIPSGSKIAGSGTMTFSVNANTGASRTGTLKVGGQTLSVTQAGADSCSYSINPAQQGFSSDGGIGSIAITAVGSGCIWTAKSNASWVTVTVGTGSGSSTAVYSVAANQSTSPRTGTITIVDKTFTVTQGRIPCDYSLSPRSQSFGSNGGTASVNVTSPACLWTAVKNVYWITILSGASGLGNGTVNYSVAANTGTASRTGTITVADYEFTVTQTAGGASCTYSITPTSNTIGTSGGSGSVAVTAGSGCAWTASSNNSWIGITSGASGTGSGTVAFSVSANTGASRTGTLTVAGQTFSITQAAGSTPCTYSISPVSQSLGSNGGTGSVNVTSSAGCTWTAVSNASWITILSGASGVGSGAVNYSVAAYSGTASRSGAMTIAGQGFTVTQAGSNAAPTISVEPPLVNFGNVRTETQSSATVKITNAGGAPLLINSIWLFGVNTDQFRQTNACTTLAPGSSCNINVTFAPSDPGTQRAMVGITSNDPTNGAVYVALSGKGI